MTPTRRAAGLALLAAGATSALGGCGSWWRPTPIPMELLYDNAGCTAQAPVLLVLLPGAHMAPAEMLSQGMVSALRQRQLAVDVVLAGATLDYIYDRSVLRRLHDDVVLPYTAAGYRRIWLAGISLGAFVAMGYAQQNPGRIEGIVAIAPYLGAAPLVQAVAQAGSPAAWAANNPLQPDQFDQRVWHWLAQPPANAPVLHLAYGTGDRFATAHRLMAQTLPPERVQTAPGGHDWPPWRTLWQQWLDKRLLPQRCS